MKKKLCGIQCSLTLMMFLVASWGGGCADEARGPGGQTPPPPPGDCRLNPCDVFISEVLTNPQGEDKLGEYVELYNPGEQIIDLRSCVLELQSGSRTKSHTIESAEPVTVPAKGYLLLGPPQATAAGYRWNVLGEMSNDPNQATFRLRAGATEIASFTYGKEYSSRLRAPKEGVSFQLDASRFSCQSSMAAEAWCPSDQTSDLGENRITPGAANLPCFVKPVCEIGECEVFFSEVLANPKGADAQSEWVELFNPTDRALDLRGCILELGPEGEDPTQHEIVSVEVVEVPAHGFLLIGPDEAVGVDYRWSKLGDLPNSAGDGQPRRLALRNGDTEVSSFRYLIAGSRRLAAPTEGVSFQLCPDRFTCAESLEESSWGAGEQASGDNRGTPGEPNTICPLLRSCELEPCDLFFTELLGNPAGEDKEMEYVELHNHGERGLNLNGCMLELQVGTSNPRQHKISGEVIVPAGTYILLGPKESTKAQYNWSSDFGTLPNSSSSGAARLRLLSDLTNEWVEVDGMSYIHPAGEGLGAPIDSVSFQLGVDIIDQVAFFTCQGNDDFTHWCPAVKGDGQNKGTPGQRNSYCRKVMCVPQDAACNDRAEEREARRPGPGEVIISEIMPNASCTPEKDQEWFEVYNTTDRELDLIHLGLYTRSAPGAPRFRISDAEMRCFTVPPRGHRVIVSKKDPVPPSGIASCFSYNGGLALSNSNGVLELRLPDDVTVVDSISWKSSVDGRSLELDPAPECMSAAGNDGSACWHVSPRPQQELCGVLGYHTAGVANEPPDACFCQEEDGAWIRIPQSFAPGELAITEFLSDVPGPEADGAGMEWVELSSLVEGYLNCGKLFVGNTAREFPWTWCWALEPGRPVVLAASTDPQQNCGLTTNLPAEQVRQLGPLSLTARGGSLVLQLQGVEVDAVRNYAAGGEGHSLQQDATGRWCPSDQPIATCQAPDGSPRMFGTPGQANLDCPAEPLPPVQEGFCRPEGVAEVRAVVPPPSGAVIVSEFFANPAGPESNKEWLELYVAQGGPYDLNWLRLQLQDDAAAVLTAEHCVTVQQGDWVLLAKSDDPALNGGLPPPRLRFNKSLLNSNIAIRLLAQDGVTLIDGMSYAPPSVEDKSVQLSSSKLDAAENDLVGSWCPSAEDGTPGAANVECAAQ